MVLMVTNLVGFGGGGGPYTPIIASTSSSFGSGVDFTSTAYPSGVVAGDLVLVFCTIPSSGPINIPSGFTSLLDVTSGTTMHQNCFYRVAAGSLSGNFSHDLTGSSIDYTEYAFRITNMQGTPEGSSSTSASTSAPDPASIAPSWGAGIGTLVIQSVAYNAAVTTTTVSAYPGGYGLNQVNYGDSTSSVSLGIAGRRLFTSSEDAGAFTLSAAQRCVTLTVAVEAA